MLAILCKRVECLTVSNALVKSRAMTETLSSTITHQLNAIELINNCVESQESQSKLENCDENSSRRILRQNGIEMHQSVCRDLDQSQCSNSSSSTHAAASSYDVIDSQSAITSRQPAQPKRGRTNHIAISDPEADTSTERGLGSSTYTNSTTHLQSSADTNSRSTLGMAKTKQSERKTDDDRPPRATFPYVCGVCGKQSKQSTNHRRHVITNHGIRPDGQKATPEEVERAKAWNRAGRDRAAKAAAAAAVASTTAFTKSYKSPEFVQSDYDYSSDADIRTIQSKVELAPPRNERSDHAKIMPVETLRFPADHHQDARSHPRRRKPKSPLSNHRRHQHLHAINTH